MEDDTSLGFTGGCGLSVICGHYCKVLKVYYVEQSQSIYVQFNRLG
jgi:hypothetical protein